MTACRSARNVNVMGSTTPGPVPQADANEPSPGVAPTGAAQPPRTANSLVLVLGLIGGFVLAMLIALPAAVETIGWRLGVGGGPFFRPVLPRLVIPVLLLAGTVWLALLVVPGLSGQDRALQLLRERYVRGEIGDAEFRRRAETLRQGR